MAVDLSSAPPKRGGSATKPKASNSLTRKTQEREEGVKGLFQIAVPVLLMTRNTADAAACAKHGDGIAHETAALAEDNDSIGKVIDWVTGVGPYAALLAVVTPFALQIAVNHGTLPAEPLTNLGVVHPETLDAEMRRQMLQERAEAQRAAFEAEQEMARLQSEVAQTTPQANNGWQEHPTPPVADAMAVHSSGNGMTN